MEPEERRQKAMEALEGCCIVKKKGKKDGKQRPRRLDTLVSTKPEMNRTIYNQCAKKHRYRTQADATRHMHVLQTLRPETELRSYYCSYCGGFHLTSKPRRRPIKGRAGDRRQDR